MIRFKSGPCPVCKFLPLDIPFYPIPERSSPDSPAQLDQSPFLVGHLAFVEHAVTAMLRSFQPVRKGRIGGRLRALPMAFAIFPISMIAQGGQVARCVVSHSVHPVFPPDFPEDMLVDPAHEVAPKAERLTALGRVSFPQPIW